MMTERADEPHTVLLVEDDTLLADLFADWLADDYRVRIANDGEAALDRVDETVDVVLLDRRLPVTSGETVLDEIRARPFDCRVVVVSAVDPGVDVVNMPIDEYLVKPVERRSLQGAVERVLSMDAVDPSDQTLARLQTKRALLEARVRPTTLENSAAFESLVRRIEELDEEASRPRRRGRQASRWLVWSWERASHGREERVSGDDG